MKKIFAVIFILFQTLLCVSQEIDTIVVKDIAISILSEAYEIEHQGQPSPEYVSTMSLSMIKRGDQTYLYVAQSAYGGWAVIPNEERCVPVMAYSLEGEFDVNLPDYAGFLVECMDVVDSVRANHIERSYIRQRRMRLLANGEGGVSTCASVVLPIVGDLEWRQTCNAYACYNCSHVYNKYCPFVPSKDSIKYLDQCSRSPLGCSAVATAMIMRYWKWPDYTLDQDGKYHYIDWNIIPNRLTNVTPMREVDMLAHLLRNCGTAIGMSYNNEYSWATIQGSSDGLSENLGYTHANWVFGGMWGAFDWLSDSIKNEIDAGRPVFCQGWKSAILPVHSHSFVIYGYKYIDDEFWFCANMGGGAWNASTWLPLDSVDGYYRERSILTHLQPNCEARARTLISLDTTFVNQDELHTEYSTSTILYGTLHPITIENGGRLIAEASEEIILLPGFTAERGSDVQLSIRQFCDENGNYVRKMPNKILGISEKSEDMETVEDVVLHNNDEFYLSPNPARRVLSVKIANDVSQIIIYGVSGHISFANQLEIDVSSLPQGIYLLRALTSDGQMRQAKFIKQ